MPYTLPTFILPCSVWHGNPAFPLPAASFTTVCNLALGRRGYPAQAPSFFIGVAEYPTIGLFPKLTDLRAYPAGAQDIVEIPTGSGRYYWVAWVDDAGKGFANEHRVAVLTQIATVWPQPTP